MKRLIVRGAVAILCLGGAAVASAASTADVLGFENPTQWSTTGASLGASPDHVQGVASLSVSNVSGSAVLRSVPLSTVAGFASPFQIRIALPRQQPDAGWSGWLQLSVDAPSRGLHSQYVGQVSLAGLPAGSFQQVSIPVPDAIVRALAGGPYDDLTVQLSLVVPGAGPYLLDDARFGSGGSDGGGGLGSNAKKVHVLYIVPSDRSENPAYTANLATAARHLQGFFQSKLGKTFTVTDPVVQVVHSAKSSQQLQSGTFDSNLRAEANALTGLDVSNDPNDRWLLYLDAAAPCNNGTGALGSAATFPANDLLGLTQQTTLDVCSGQPDTQQPRCRWVGGMGHELGHTLGLPHPRGCEDGDTTVTCPQNALMWLGYITYPDAIFTSDDVARLNQDPQLQPEQLSGVPADCNQVAH